jgi:hypothetical protein
LPEGRLTRVAEEGLPEAVEQFIARHINSVEKLEILLLVAKDRQRRWTPPEVLQQIQSSLGSVQQRLHELQQDGLLSLEHDDRFRFQPRTPELEACVAALKGAYEQRRIKVIEAIYNPRKDTLRLFSDVFRIRRENQ